MINEYFDLLDEKGVPTGEKKLRSLVHKDGDWHKGIHAWIMNDNHEFLIQKRSSNKDSNPNKWTRSLTGHAVSGEDSLTTVIKELAEELGLEATPDQIQYLFTSKKQTVLNNGTFISNEFDDIYLIKINPDLTKIKLQEEEVAEVKIIPLTELKNLLVSGDPQFVSEPEEDPIFIKYLAEIEKI